MKEGYVSVPRSIKETSFFPQGEFTYFEAVVDMRMSMRHAPCSTIINGKSINLGINEIAMSQSFMGKRYGWNRQKVRTFIKHLKSNHAINQRLDQGETVITLLKSSVFEIKEDESNQPINQPINQLPTNCQPTANHNNKEERVKGKETAPSKGSRFVKPSLDEIIAYGATRKPAFTNAQGFLDYYTSNGWKVGKNPMKDWKATVRNWNREAEKQSKDTDTSSRRFTEY